MNITRPAFLAFWIGFASICSTNAVRAAPVDEPAVLTLEHEREVQRRPINVGVLAGYGLGIGSGTLTTHNPYAGGFGVQADYELRSGVVLGLGMDGFLGERSRQLSASLTPTVVDSWARYVLAHVRVGYNFRMAALGSFVDVRPSLWVGAAMGFVPADGRFTSGMATALLLSPGVSIHYALGDGGFYLGEDIRVSVPLGPSVRSGLLILFTVGRRI
jgi:hypothetical protein